MTGKRGRAIFRLIGTKDLIPKDSMNKDAALYYQNALELQLEDGLRAMEEYTRAIELEPAFADAYVRRGTLRYKILKQYEDALSDFDEAVRLGPPVAIAYLHRAIVKCHLLKFDDALPDYNRSLELDPYDERAYFNRGKLKFMLKYDEEDVIADLEKAIRLGFAPAAELIRMFYGKDPAGFRQSLDAAVKEKAGQFKK
jgi:tetratricopeptide (TPR) repeat protein